MLNVTEGITNVYTSQTVRPYIRASLSPNLWPGFQQSISSSTSLGGFTESLNFGTAFYKSQFITSGRRTSFTDLTRITAWPYTMGNSSSSIATGLTDITVGGKFYLNGETLNYFVINGYRDLIRLTTSGGTVWSGQTVLYSGASGSILDYAPISDSKGYIAGGSFVNSYYSYNVNYVDFLGASRKILKEVLYLDPSETKCINVFPNTPNTLIYKQTGLSVSYLAKTEVDAYGVYEKERIFELGRNASIELMNMSLGESFVYMPFRIKEQVVNSSGGITSTVTQSIAYWIYRQPVQSDYTEEYSLIYSAGNSLSITNTSDYTYLWAGNTTQTGLTRFEFVMASTSNDSADFYFTKDIRVDISADIISYSNRNNDSMSLKLANFRYDTIFAGGSETIPVPGVSCIIFIGGTCILS